MSQDNESAGLKIALAGFISLSVILAVACYFLYTAYMKSEAGRQAAEQRSRAQISSPARAPR